MVLFPGQHEAPLEYSFEQSSYDNPPDYEALSYTWGESFQGEDLFEAGRERALKATAPDVAEEAAIGD